MSFGVFFGFGGSRVRALGSKIGAGPGPVPAQALDPPTPKNTPKKLNSVSSISKSVLRW